MSSISGKGGPFIFLAKCLAMGLALLISIGFPAGYLYFGYQREKAVLQGELAVHAQLISQLINSNPEYWQFETHRIAEQLRHGEERGPYWHRIYDENGKLVAQSPETAPEFVWPPLTVEQTLLDYGQPVGTLAMTQSLAALYRGSMLVAVLAILGGVSAYCGFRLLPLRSLTHAWDRVAYLASHDPLTGLPNRVLFLDRLEQTLASAPRQADVVTVHSLDLDHFKDINDTLGHAAGDLLLKLSGARMKTCLRPGDTLARIAGDEFAIIQNGTEKPETAEALARRIIAELNRPFDLNGRAAAIGVSVGMATFSSDRPVTPSQLLMHADLALYKSKANGRGTYHFFMDDMDAALQERKALEMDLRVALREKQLTVSYQPQVDLVTQRIVGLEALARWHHPVRGDVPPSQFIPVAESAGLIRALGEWVLETACADAVKWTPLRVAVNLSPSQLQQSNIVAIVERALRQSGLPPEQLELEITEEVLISDTKRTLEVLNALNRLGVRIAMDDFGTGYSSLAYLRRFPFDKIKIAQSFVSDVDRNSDARAIVRAIVGLSHALSMHINAEGVETVEQAKTLLAEGCEEAQGYLYGHPLTSEELDALLAKAGGAYAPLESTAAA